MDTLQPSPWNGEPFPPEAGRTILLVDDDMELRRGMRDFLTGSGCQVIEARNSYDGLFLCAQHGASIDLLLTEINLLPVSGIKLAENVLRLFPQMQVMCTSQCEETRPLRYWMKYLNASFLRKPFSPVELHEAVRGALSGNRLEEPYPVLEARSAPDGSREHAATSADPLFWLKDF
jgi:DNA-binding NtrC family response regulator